jgi:hypothetical protein
VTATNGVETVTQESEPGPLVDDVPTNDNFADALDLGSSSPTTVAGDNYYATSEDGENNAAATPVEHSVWYRWTAPQSKAYFVDGCSSAAAAYRFAVNVYDGSGAAVDELVRPSGASVGCGDDAPYARTYFRAEAGSTYFIQAGNVESRSALDFTLSIDEVPAPEFASLPTLTGDALEGSTLSLHSQPEDSVLTTDEEIFWNLCDTAGDNCTDLEDITTSDAELAAAMVGKRLRATVTYTNANGSISQSVLSDVVKADSDGDGVPDEDDDCPSDAQGSGKSNGCPLEEIDVVVDPSLSGTAQVGSAIALDLGSAVSSPGLDANVNPFVYTVDWLSCTSTTVIESCAARTGSSEAYTPTAGDVGRSIRAKVVWRNGDAVEETVYSAATVAVTAVPVTPPSAGGGGGGGNTQPPAATNPLILTVKKSLGSLTPKKGVITINGAVVSCGASATGPCTGTITFNVIKGKTSAKYIEYPIWVAPGKTSAVTVKLKSAKLKAIAKAKSVKTTVKISVAAPGFGPSIATATATLKPQKK